MKDGQAFIIIAEMKHHPYNLKGSTLEVFSALYCLTRKRAFLGTYMDLASWIEIEPKTLRRAIEKLQERGLVYAEPCAEGSNRYEFQAHPIKGYPLPDYKYSGRKSITDYPVIDAQNLDEYRKEIEATGGVIDPTKGQNVPPQGQNVPPQGQNVPELKESNKENNTNNIYNKTSFLTKEVVVGGKPTAAAHQNLKKEEEEIEPYPTTLKEVLQYVREKQPGISMEVARDFFVYYSAKGWRYKNNGRVRNWKAELFLFDQRGKRWEKERAAKSFVKAQMGAPQAVLELEEQMREQRHREREKMDEEANTPEAIAARDAFFDKFCKK